MVTQLYNQKLPYIKYTNSIKLSPQIIIFTNILKNSDPQNISALLIIIFIIILILLSNPNMHLFIIYYLLIQLK